MAARAIVSDWILVTGQPGCGKTTAVQTMILFLEQLGYECRGFYTQEVRDASGHRIGFDVVTVPDKKRGILARNNGSLPSHYPKTGKYLVDVASFESLALPSLTLGDGKDLSADKPIVYVLDEIGRMELHSNLFPIQVRELLRSNVRLVGAITASRYGHSVPFCDEVSQCPGVQVHKLMKSTRDSVVKEILQYIEKEWNNKAMIK